MQAAPPVASPALQGVSLVMVAKMLFKPIAISTFPVSVLGAFMDDDGVAPVLVRLGGIDELDAAPAEDAVALLLGALSRA